MLKTLHRKWLIPAATPMSQFEIPPIFKITGGCLNLASSYPLSFKQLPGVAWNLNLHLYGSFKLSQVSV